MCGIAGIVDARGLQPAARDELSAMAAALRHRGPDGEGSWADGHAALGHRRLSIVDLSENGRQPMGDPDTGVQLVCNGEIYNHAALRRDEATYPFASQTDIEVILPLYRRFGARCTDALTGMFAFALWDAPRRRLVLARDRIGEKPLFYAVVGARIAFASEIKALLTLPWIGRRPDPAALGTLLAQQSIPAPMTAFADIRQLRPGERLVWEDGRIATEIYWSPDLRRRGAMTMGAALGEYDALMREAVRLQMLADVPVGVMLSGGVDSGTIARLASETSAATVNTYCVGFERPGRPDVEFARAREAASILGVRHGEVNLPDLDFGHAVATLAHYDQPMSSMVALYADRLAAAMRREVKVVLAGNGADEIFAGYAGYARLPLLEAALGLGTWVPAAALPMRMRPLVAAASGGPAAQRGAALAGVASTLAGRIATPALYAALRDAPPGAAAVEVATRAGARSLLDATRVADLMVSHQHGHAVIADMAGMAHGLEIRAPFLDHRVIEFATRLPQHLLLGCPPRARTTKNLVKRHLLQRFPTSLVHAPKIGFGFSIDIAGLLRGAWSAPVRRLLLEGAYLDLGLFDRDGARWALAGSYGATCMLLSVAIWVETTLLGRSPAQVAGLEAAA
jgi:asparagine synthase (glutamine-hydrolysing)